MLQTNHDIDSKKGGLWFLLLNIELLSPIGSKEERVLQ